jgi:hypothetical protein
LKAGQTTVDIELRRGFANCLAAASIKGGTIVEQPVTHVAFLAVTIRWRIYGSVIQESSLVAGQIAGLLIDIAIRAGNDNVEIVVPLSVVVRIVRGNWTSP